MNAGILLEAAMEVGEITPLEYMIGMRRPVAYAEVEALMTQTEVNGGQFAAIFDSEWKRASPHVRHFLAIATARALPLMLGMVIDQVHRRLEQQFYIDLNLLTAAEWQRMIHPSPAPTLFVLGDKLSARRVKQWVRKGYTNWFRRMVRDVRRMRRAAVWYQEDNGRRFRILDHACVPQAQDMFSLVGMGVRVDEVLLDVQDQLHQEAQLVRKPLKRITRLFADLGYGNLLARFLKGDPVELQHPDSPFRFVIRPFTHQGQLRERTLRPGYSIPFDLRLYAEDNTYLGQLCAVVRQTPILDQLLAVILLIESGEEAEFLKRANWHEVGCIDAMRQYVLPHYPHVEEFFKDPDVPVVTDPATIRLVVTAGGSTATLNNHEAELLAHRQQLWDPIAEIIKNWLRELYGTHFYMGNVICGTAASGSTKKKST